MTSFSSAYQPRPLEATFGYFNPAHSPDENTKRMRHVLNLSTALGYIPLVGTIVGIARIIFFSKFTHESYNSYSNNERLFSRLQVARGSIEALSLGIIFFIPDVIFTINRELESAMKGMFFYSSFGEFKDDYHS